MSGPSHPRVVVVGLGPAGADLVTPATTAAIDAIPRQWLRTGRHPAADEVAPGAATFDDVYDGAADFADVYHTIATRLVAEAHDHGEVLYAVPGSPAVLERSVELLRQRSVRAGVEVEVVPALSFLDLAWVRLGVDPVEVGVRLVDGHCFDTAAAGEHGPLLVAHCHNRRVLSDIKLTMDDPPDQPVTVLWHLGCSDERIFEVAWHDLDRVVEADHLTSVYIPAVGTSTAAELRELDEVVRTLRRECPWDRKQTHHSLRRYLLEETYELADAIDAFDETSGDGLDDLEEELGDVLFQVFFHAALATERGEFTAADVARGIREKLVRRHPHVFGDVEVADADEVYANWQDIKAKEKANRSSVVDGLAVSLPSLLLATEVISAAAKLGLDAEALLNSRLPLGVDALHPDALHPDTIGDSLFALVGQCRQLGIDPEGALRSTALRVRDEVRAVEAERAAGHDPVG